MRGDRYDDVLNISPFASPARDYTRELPETSENIISRGKIRRRAGVCTRTFHARNANVICIQRVLVGHGNANNLPRGDIHFPRAPRRGLLRLSPRVHTGEVD